jgi:hypothetical protein
MQEHIEEITQYRIAGDWLVYLLLLRDGGLSFNAESLNQHRRHGNSVTIGSKAQGHLDEIRSLHAHAQRLFPLSAATRRGRGIRRQAAHPLRVAEPFSWDG